jgi:hypothetical protein
MIGDDERFDVRVIETEAFSVFVSEGDNSPTLFTADSLRTSGLLFTHTGWGADVFAGG